MNGIQIVLMLLAVGTALPIYQVWTMVKVPRSRLKEWRREFGSLKGHMTPLVLVDSSVWRCLGRTAALVFINGSYGMLAHTYAAESPLEL